MNRAQRRYLTEEKGDDDLVRQHGGILDRCARAVARRTGGAVTPDDLWSAGALGLLEARRRFDSSRGIKFETFAEHRIRGAMLDELRKLDHLPRRLRGETERVRKGRQQLEHTLGRPPEADELAEALGLELDALAVLEGVSEPVLEWGPHLAMASEDPGAEQSVERREMVGRMTEAIGLLPERLGILLSLHYVEELTYKEIAQVLEVSEPRVCQLHAEAVSRLRGHLTDR